MKLIALLLCAIAPFFVIALPSQENPFFPGDNSRFLGDVSFPDGSHVKSGSKLTKTWRVLNNGSVEWKARELRSLDDLQGFKVVKSVPFSAKPKTEVNISVDLIAPKNPGHYTIYFKQWVKVGKDWKIALPGKKAVYLDIIVD